MHRSRIVKNDQGESVQVQTGPVHRFHPLVEEDCAICKHRHERYEQGVVNVSFCTASCPLIVSASDRVARGLIRAGSHLYLLQAYCRRKRCDLLSR